MSLDDLIDNLAVAARAVENAGGDDEPEWISSHIDTALEALSEAMGEAVRRKRAEYETERGDALCHARQDEALFRNFYGDA